MRGQIERVVVSGAGVRLAKLNRVIVDAAAIETALQLVHRLVYHISLGRIRDIKPKHKLSLFLTVLLFGP